MALGQLSRYRLAFVNECSDWKRKCIALLDQVFPEYSKLFSDTFGVTSRELLYKLLSKASKGRFGVSKANEIHDAEANTFGVSFAKDAFAFQIKQIITQINFIEEQLKELESAISILLHKPTKLFLLSLVLVMF